MTTVDLCVVNYNTQEKLARFLDALASDMPYDDCPWNLYLADNGSTDGSVEYILKREQDFPFNALAFNENVGYAAACNQLAAAGNGDVVGLLNADVWMNSKDVRAIAQSFADYPEQAIMGPKQRDEQGFITHAGIEGTNTKPKLRGWKVRDQDDTLFRSRERMLSVSGSAFFVRRSVWEKLTADPDYKKVCIDLFGEEAEGAFLPTQHYYEETFCAYFAGHRGHAIFYDGRISIGHSWHASHEVGSEQDKLFHVSRDYFRRACDQIGIEHD